VISPVLLFLLYVLLGFAALATFVVVRMVVLYTPIVGRVFEEKPLFMPLQVEPEPDGEPVRFQTPDGLSLAGTYFRHRAAKRTGQIVFCHEYLGNRWSALAYCNHLRDRGFDLFSFDFRNHGESQSDPVYEPLQWVSDHEVRDLRAALDYLRTRPDADPSGVALFGISRGGGAALCAAAADPSVWAVITDGAFPTRGTVVAYMHRWAEIYVGMHKYWQTRAFRGIFSRILDILGTTGLWRSQVRRHCHFPELERAVSQLSPRPWLMIHGAADVYIGLPIAHRFFERAGTPKELWVVAGAKHNRCREVDPEVYASRVVMFLEQYAPRPLAFPKTVTATAAIAELPRAMAAIPTAVPLALGAARQSP
jgi:uncharacterized protein